MTRQPGCHSDRAPGRRAPWWSVSTRCGAHNGYMDEAQLRQCEGCAYRHHLPRESYAEYARRELKRGGAE